jgi:actin-related protein 2
MLEVLFETMNVPAVQVAPQALLVAYARGLLTGMIVDSGDGVTHVVPIAESYILPDLIGRMNIAGRDVTEQLVKLLTLRGYSFHKSSDFEVVRCIKEKLCFISANTKVDRKLAVETTTYTVPYELPDSRIIKVAQERFEAPEVLFFPELAGKEDDGVSKLLYDAIMKAPITLRKNFFGAVVVSGGTTMFPGFSTRLTNDLTDMVTKNILKDNKDKARGYKINVEDPPNRRFLVYQGGTVLANLSKSKIGSWATKHEYQEVGARTIVNRWQSLT